MGYPRIGLSSLVVGGLGKVEKTKMCKIRHWLPSMYCLELAGRGSLCLPLLLNKDRYRVGLGGKIGLFYVLYNFTVGLKT